MCVVWLGWCGIRMQAEALVPQPAYGFNTTTAKPQRNTNTLMPQPVYGYHTTPPQPNHNVTPTHIEPEQYTP